MNEFLQAQVDNIIHELVAKESVDRDPGTTSRMAPIPLKRIVSVSSEVRSRS